MLLSTMYQAISEFLRKIRTVLNFCIQWLVVLATSFYQRYLSPIKGFSCAYRVYYNTESCSSYVKRLFIEQDLQSAIVLANKRFQDCSHANRILMSKQENEENFQDLIGRRKALRLFSFFSLGVFSPQVRGCPGVNACCSSLLDGDDDDSND
jgi:putative component of membrane protein insertase Oxa1/YidC/SpoIIIJ protein YidD